MQYSTEDTAAAVARHHAERGMVGDGAPKYFVRTFGCQQNEADSEKLAGLAELMGYTATDSPEEASLILVNTCAVRRHAEDRALSVIGEYKHIKSQNPELVIGVGGCMVTQKSRAEQIKMSCPYVNFTFDTASLGALPSLVLDAVCGGRRRFITDGEPSVNEGIPSVSETSHSAWLSIMYGCNNFCTYCIVPYVRGRERSRRAEDIIDEARHLIDKGAREITLLGQNVNSYGHDLDKKYNIASLLRELCALPGDFRLRFMTSHPKDASDELLRTIAEEEKMIKHLHLPVQSGSNEILRRMNRKYTVEHYKGIISRMRELCPDVTLTSDIIVGFPGETEEDFECTMELLREVRYDMVFSFIYSPREGTPAAKMEPAVPRDTAGERLRRLTALQEDISMERNMRFVGRRVRVLTEGVSRTCDDMLTGRGDIARPVHFAGDRSLIGKPVELEITSCGSFAFEGRLAE